MDWESFLPPFFGVIAAFAVQWLGKKYDRRKDRRKFLLEIKEELESCYDLLKGHGNRVPIDMWESGKAVGILSLIRHEIKIQLAEVYFKIQCHNYEAEKVREVSIIAETTKPKSDEPWPRFFTDAERLHRALSGRLSESEMALREDIDKLLKQNIWEIGASPKKEDVGSPQDPGMISIGVGALAFFAGLILFGVFLGEFVHEVSHTVAILIFGLPIESWSLTNITYLASPNPAVNVIVRVAGGTGQALISVILFWYATTWEKRTAASTTWAKVFHTRQPLKLSVLFGFEVTFLAMAFHGVVTAIWEAFLAQSYEQLHNDVFIWVAIILSGAALSAYIVYRRYQKLTP